MSLYPYSFYKLKKTFYEHSKLLVENEKKGFDEIQVYQFNKFKKIVEKAYQHAPFYKAFYNQNDFNPSVLKNIDDTDKKWCRKTP